MTAFAILEPQDLRSSSRDLLVALQAPSGAFPACPTFAVYQYSWLRDGTYIALALDVAAVLPLGVPKFIVSTIAYSHLLPPERIAPDLMMILWAGGLYGLNPICRAVLSQACGAVLGAARHGMKPDSDRPLVGMTSLGSSCLKYMKHLKPELEKRGYDVAVFHSTGMGGRAFEAIAAQKGFAAVFDLCIQEVSNHHNGTVVTSAGVSVCAIETSTVAPLGMEPAVG